MRRRAAADRRGSSLLLVLGILTIFGLVLGVLATVLLADLASSRRRANDRSTPPSSRARERTGRAACSWRAAACLPRRSASTGGEIAVVTDELPDGRLRVVSTGRVREGEASLAARREVTVFAAPPRAR